MASRMTAAACSAARPFVEVGQPGERAGRVQVAVPTGRQAHRVALRGAKVRVDPLGLALVSITAIEPGRWRRTFIHVAWAVVDVRHGQRLAGRRGAPGRDRQDGDSFPWSTAV